MSDVFIFQGRPEDEVFTFEDHETGKFWHFNVSECVRTLSKYSFSEWHAIGIQWGWTPVPRDWIEQMVREGRRSFEESRVAQLQPPYSEMPVLMILWPDGTSVLLDGTHRMINAYRKRRAKIAVIQLPMGVARAFQIDLPGKGTLDLDTPRVPDDELGAFLKKRGVV